MAKHERMVVEYIEVDDLTPLVDNPRQITADGVARLRGSIKELGFFKPGLYWVDPETGSRHVIGGHQRRGVLALLKEQKALPFVVEFANGRSVEVTSEMPCVEFMGTRAEAMAVAIRDNQEDGEWDWEKLPQFTAKLQDDLKALGKMDMPAMTGFGSDTLRDLAVLAGDPSVRLNKLRSESEPSGGGGGGGGGGTGSSSMGITAGFVCGGLRGRVKHTTADRFLKCFEGVQKAIGSDELDAVLNELITRVEAS